MIPMKLVDYKMLKRRQLEGDLGVVKEEWEIAGLCLSRGDRARVIAETALGFLRPSWRFMVKRCLPSELKWHLLSAQKQAVLGGFCSLGFWLQVCGVSANIAL